jgi:hypothetical protein
MAQTQTYRNPSVAPARRGQTEQAFSNVSNWGNRAVKHDLGAFELRADDERRQQTADVQGVLLPQQGGSAPSTRLQRRQHADRVTDEAS